MPARKGTKTCRTPFHVRKGNFHKRLEAISKPHFGLSKSLILKGLEGVLKPVLGKNPDSPITAVDIAGKAPEILMSIRWSFLTMRVALVAFSRKVKNQPMRNRKPKSKSFDESKLRAISVGTYACINRFLTEKRQFV
jgi:hypothetical protein